MQSCENYFSWYPRYNKYSPCHTLWLCANKYDCYIIMGLKSPIMASICSEFEIPQRVHCCPGLCKEPTPCRKKTKHYENKSYIPCEFLDTTQFISATKHQNVIWLQWLWVQNTNLKYTYVLEIKVSVMGLPNAVTILRIQMKRHML